MITRMGIMTNHLGLPTCRTLVINSDRVTSRKYKWNVSRYKVTQSRPKREAINRDPTTEEQSYIYGRYLSDVT